MKLWYYTVDHQSNLWTLHVSFIYIYIFKCNLFVFPPNVFIVWSDFSNDLINFKCIIILKFIYFMGFLYTYIFTHFVHKLWFLCDISSCLVDFFWRSDHVVLFTSHLIFPPITFSHVVFHRQVMWFYYLENFSHNFIFTCRSCGFVYFTW